MKHVDSDITLNADLPGTCMLASDNPLFTIPENILVTSAHPDMVLVGEDEVILIELTIPHNSMESLSNARKHKSENESYRQALSDLEVRKGYCLQPIHQRVRITLILALCIAEGSSESSTIGN